MRLCVDIGERRVLVRLAIYSHNNLASTPPQGTIQRICLTERTCDACQTKSMFRFVEKRVQIYYSCIISRSRIVILFFGQQHLYVTSDAVQQCKVQILKTKTHTHRVMSFLSILNRVIVLILLLDKRTFVLHSVLAGHTTDVHNVMQPSCSIAAMFALSAIPC